MWWILDVGENYCITSEQTYASKTYLKVINKITSDVGNARFKGSEMVWTIRLYNSVILLTEAKFNLDFQEVAEHREYENRRVRASLSCVYRCSKICERDRTKWRLVNVVFGCEDMVSSSLKRAKHRMQSSSKSTATGASLNKHHKSEDLQRKYWNYC